MSYCLLLLSFCLAIGNGAYYTLLYMTSIQSPFICNYYLKQKFILVTYASILSNIYFQSELLTGFTISFILGHFVWKCLFTYGSPYPQLSSKRKHLYTYCFFILLCLYYLLIIQRTKIIQIHLCCH